MNLPTRSFSLSLFCTVILALAGCATTHRPQPLSRFEAGRTHWVLGPSEALDGLCLINLLRADPFYLRFLPEPYARWAPLLGPAEKAALAHLGHRLVDVDHELVSAKLTLVFSASGSETIEDLLATVESDERWAAMRAAYLASPSAEGDDFAGMNDVRGDLRTLLTFLLRNDFPGVWRKEALPRIDAAIVALRPRLAQLDVVGWDEQVLGRDLGIRELRMDVLAYVKPHGIRVVGWRFLSDATYPPEVTATTALHELLHPPFARRGKIAERLTALEADPFFQRLVHEHNPSFGYTNAPGLTEEDCAEAIHIFNADRHGLLRKNDGAPRTGAEYFRDQDDGIHVLAFILYEELKAADFTHWTTFEAFLLDLFDQGVLKPGTLQQRFETYPDHYDVRALHAASGK